jgi:hypothetical protein
MGHRPGTIGRRLFDLHLRHPYAEQGWLVVLKEVRSNQREIMVIVLAARIRIPLDTTWVPIITDQTFTAQLYGCS